MSGSSWTATAAGPRRAASAGSPGHARGARRVTEIVKVCPDLGVTHLTLYAFSTENWRRPLAEVEGLMRIFRQYIRSKMDGLRAQRRAGALHRHAPPGAAAAARADARRSRTRTRDCRGLNLSIAIDYGGRDELTRAVRALSRAVAAGRAVRRGDLRGRAFGRARHPRPARPGLHHPHLGRAAHLELPALAGGLRRVRLPRDRLAGLHGPARSPRRSTPTAPDSAGSATSLPPCGSWGPDGSISAPRAKA